MIRIHGTIADSTSRNSKDVSKWMLSKGFFLRRLFRDSRIMFQNNTETSGN